MCLLERYPRGLLSVKTQKTHFYLRMLDQFFALITNLVSDAPTDQVQYMNLSLKVELLCMGLDPTDNPRTNIW